MGENSTLNVNSDIPIPYAENIKTIAEPNYNYSVAYTDWNNRIEVHIDKQNWFISSDGAKVDLGYRNGLYSSTNGTLYSWGSENNYGQLGTGLDSWDEGGPAVIEIGGAVPILSNIIDFDMTDYTAIALDKDGNVYVWGQNMNHILGLDDEDESIAIPTILYSIK